MFRQYRAPASGMASKKQTGHTSEGSRGHMGQRSFTRLDTKARASHPQRPIQIRNRDPTVSNRLKFSHLCRVHGGLTCWGLDHSLRSDSSHPSLLGPGRCWA